MNGNGRKIGRSTNNGHASIADKHAIAQYWATKPQTYAVEHGGQTFLGSDNELVIVEPGSREFFEHADSTLLAWNHPLHDENPFGRIFPYERYRGKQVLEVVTMGILRHNCNARVPVRHPYSMQRL